MKVTRRQLRRLINELSMYDPMHGMRRLEEPAYSKVMGVLDDPDASEEYVKQFHQLGDALSDYKDPRPGMPDDSYEGVKAQQADYLQHAGQEIESYLPGFLNLPKDVIEAVVEFVFLSKDTTLHITINDDMVDHEFGIDGYYDDEHFQEEIAEKYNVMMMRLRNNPKSHDPKFYYIYAAHSTYKEADPFSRIDPKGFGDAQTGFHDGFREEYQKVTTNRAHKIDSIVVEQAFIQMMRDLRPDCREEVIN